MNKNIFNDPLRDQIADTRTVSLSGRDVRDLVRLLGLLIGASGNSSVAKVREAAAGYIDREMLVEHARQVARRRAKRARFFDPGMLGEPAWDILLLLYIEEGERLLRTSHVTTAGETAPTTGLRWLNYLESKELVTRQSSRTDGRVEYVYLTDKARNALDSYFSETLTMGQ